MDLEELIERGRRKMSKIEIDESRTCATCKYVKKGFASPFLWQCKKSIDVEKFDSVAGRRTTRVYLDDSESPACCSTARARESACGPSGRFYEPSLLTRFWRKVML